MRRSIAVGLCVGSLVFTGCSVGASGTATTSASLPSDGSATQSAAASDVQAQGSSPEIPLDLTPEGAFPILDRQGRGPSDIVLPGTHPQLTVRIACAEPGASFTILYDSEKKFWGGCPDDGSVAGTFAATSPDAP